MRDRLISAFDHVVYFWPAEAWEAIAWARRKRDDEPEVVYLPRPGRRRRRAA